MWRCVERLVIVVILFFLSVLFFVIELNYYLCSGENVVFLVFLLFNVLKNGC